MRVHLTSEPDEAVCMASPYDRDFINQFKARIPYDGRSWDPSRKRWIISVLYATELLAFLAEAQAEVLDSRQAGTIEGPVGPSMPDDLRHAFDTLYLAYTAPLCVAEASYKALALYLHPDKGGDASQFSHLATAIGVVRSYLLAPRHVNQGVYDDEDIPF